MKISGKKVAEEVRNELKNRIAKLEESGITPKLAIITLGPEGAWETYVRNKLRVAEELGITAAFINLADADEEALIKKVQEIDEDPSYHGIIVQRPIPKEFNRERVVNAISRAKDIDGFRGDSRFKVPVWLATERLIKESFKELSINKPWKDLSFTIIGKGETAGAPAAAELKKMGVNVHVIDSKTQDPDQLIKASDVVITSVGKSRIVNATNLKKGAILIGVGTHTENGKLKGDYNEEEIEQIAATYTPTPGGVGPVNLSYLFSNLIDAAIHAT